VKRRPTSYFRASGAMMLAPCVPLGRYGLMSSVAVVRGTTATLKSKPSACVFTGGHSRLVGGRCSSRSAQITGRPLGLQPLHRAHKSPALVPKAKSEQSEPVGHQTGKSTGDASGPLSPEQMQHLREFQKGAARLSFAEESRTLVAQGSWGTLSTNSQELEGFPAGSFASYAADTNGCPIMSFSTLSSHTTDLLADGRCSLTVFSKNFSGAADARVSISGTMIKIEDEEEAKASREIYLQKHPDAFWVDFGDFSWWRMEKVELARLVGGFGRAGTVSAADYEAAEPDFVAGFAPMVTCHVVCFLSVVSTEASSTVVVDHWSHERRSRRLNSSMRCTLCLQLCRKSTKL